MVDAPDRLHVRNPDTAPPGGWSYTQPETGRSWSRSDSLDILAQEIRLHRVHNALPAGDPIDDVHQQTGQRLIDTGHADRVVVSGTVRRTVSQYWHGLAGYATIRAFELTGRPTLVSETEANRRALVCSVCPRNVQNQGTGVMQRMTDDMMRQLAGGRSTESDPLLQTCAVCSCKTATLVHFTGELLAAAGTLKNLSAYPAQCWKHTANQP